MSRQRLELRTGEVVCHGRARLRDYQHRFSHLGSDNSGKGNIEEAPGEEVVGVLYGLTEDQESRLRPFEIGYQELEIVVELGGPDKQRRAYTFSSRVVTESLFPIVDYYAHYRQGMKENNFPQKYVRYIEKQAGL